MDIEFKCPACGKHVLRLRSHVVSEYDVVPTGQPDDLSTIWTDGLPDQASPTVLGFFCGACDRQIAGDVQSLRGWLEANGMLRRTGEVHAEQT